MVANAVLLVLTREQGPHEPPRVAASLESWKQGELWALGIGSQKYPFLADQRDQSWASGGGHLGSKGCGA